MLRSDGATNARSPAPPETGPEAGPADGLERYQARLAYAIHDGITQVVTASVLELEWLARHAEAGPSEAAVALREASQRMRAALEELRSVLDALGPSEQSHVQPIEDLLRSVIERWRLPATWSVEGDTTELPPPVLEAAESVIREGVANAAKHADTDEVAIHVLASDQAVEVSIEDRGRGFREEAASNGHLGLEMLRRRVAEVDGTLDIRSTPGAGTRVVAQLPVERPAAGERKERTG